MAASVCRVGSTVGRVLAQTRSVSLPSRSSSKKEPEVASQELEEVWRRFAQAVTSVSILASAGLERQQGQVTNSDAGFSRR